MNNRIDAIYARQSVDKKDSITEKVYTQREFEWLKDEIEKIK